MPDTTIWPPCSPAPGRCRRPSRPADRVLVVLHDDERVAQVPEPHEGLDQPAVVALVQADARLVEHVEHADEARADLRREPDALRLAAGQRAGRAVEGEVVQPDVDEELQPLVDLLEHPLGDLLLARAEVERAQELRALADRHRRRPRRWTSRRASPRGSPA